jgi:polyhydroxyalkanoate synthesis regulator phasin
MIKNSIKTLVLLGSLAIGAGSIACAQDSGALIDALVKKGILNDQEAEDIRADLGRDFATQASAGKLDIASSITKLKISGDARVRYQNDNEQGNPAGVAGDRDRNRYRYRIRFGVLADLGPKWSAGFRLETASSATSTNADLGGGTDNFDKTGDGVYFGQAYLNYRDADFLGADALDLRFGKLPHKFFNPGVNGFWIDSDINFEGLAQELVYNDVGLKESTLSVRAGQFVLNNNAANSGAGPTGTTSDTGSTGTGSKGVEPSMLLMAQVEYAAKVSATTFWKAAPTIVAFAAPSGHDRGANNAAAQASDTAVYNDLATVLLPFEYTMALGEKPISFYATYGYNIFGDDRANRMAAGVAPVEADSNIYNLGVRYGENKFAGDYQLTAEYRHIGNGSFSPLLLDSDFNGGLLNGEGFILSGVYSWTPAITTTVTYFNSFNIEKDRAAGSTSGSIITRGNGFGEAHVLQVDLSAKF